MHEQMTVDPNSVQAIFAKVVGADAQVRDQILDAECQDDIELRNCVEALLHAIDNPASNLGLPLHEREVSPPSKDLDISEPHAAHTTDQTLAGSSDDKHRESRNLAHAGMQIGDRYELRKKIGEGGMGEVWVAKQTQPVKRNVALKLIKPGMDSRSVLARFEQERQALAIMEHPNIAQVLDAGMTSSGQPYFVMELVNGLSITKFCDEAKLSIDQRLKLFVPICQAIQHAHLKGIVHRDLKPANILVTMVDGHPVPKVIDFGVAKAISGKLTDASLSTDFGAVVGTLEYMSPEQAGFSGVDIDTRTDVYSLGIILYELLTGLRPLDAARFKQAALTEMIRLIKEEEPSKPSTRVSTDASLPSLAALRQTEPRKLTAALRGELDWIVLKCLEKNRDRRYETVNSLSQDVLRFLADEPVLAGPPSARYRLQKFVKRNRTGVLIATLLTLALVAGTIGTTSGMIWALTEKKRATNETKRARIEAKTSAAVARLQAKALAGVGPSVALGRDTILLEEILDRTIQEIETDLADEPAVEAKLRTTIGATYREMGLYEQAEKNSRRALELYRQLRDGDDPDVAAELNQLGQTLYFSDNKTKAEQLLRDSIAMWSRLDVSTDDDLEFSALRNLATLLTNDDRTTEARELLDRALVMTRKLDAGDHNADVATVLNAFGNLERRDHQYELARDYYEQALKLHQQALPANHPFIFVDLRNIAGLLNEMGKADEAEKLLLDTIDRQRIILDLHPDLALSLANLGSLLRRAGRFGEAEKVLREAIDIASKSLGDNHTKTREYMNRLGLVQAERGQLEESLATQQELLAISIRTDGEISKATASIYNDVAYSLMKLKRLDEASEMFQKAVSISEQVYPPGNDRALMMLNNLARCLSAMGQLDEAKQTFDRVLEQRRAIYGEKHQSIANTLSSIGSIYLKQKDLNKAEEFKQASIAMYSDVLGEDHLYTLIVKNTLGQIKFQQGKYEEARQIFTNVIQRFRDVFGEDNSNTLTARLMLGMALNQLNEFEPARDELEAVLSREKPILPEQSVAMTRYWLGKTLISLKQFSEAEPMLLQAANFAEENGELSTTYDVDPVGLVVELYQQWHAETPDAGYDLKAAQWRAKQTEPAENKE